MRTVLLTLAIFAIYFCIAELIFTFPVNAQTSCQQMYNGGQACPTENISLDKKILNPQTNKMVDNLGINDPKFQPGSTINFQISLTNTSKEEIKRIIVKDIFPQFITFNKGPGKFDVNTRTLSFEANNLKSEETRNFMVFATVSKSNELPIDQGTMCVTNQTTATENDKDISKDNSTFCIQKHLPASETKGGIPVLSAPNIKSTPATGAESLILFSLIPTGITGWILRKYSFK